LSNLATSCFCRRLLPRRSRVELSPLFNKCELELKRKVILRRNPFRQDPNMSYAIPGLDPVVTAPDTSAYLRAEPTWPDVRSGLARIVIGYLIIIFGNGLGAFLVLFAIFQGHLFADFN